MGFFSSEYFIFPLTDVRYYYHYFVKAKSKYDCGITTPAKPNPAQKYEKRTPDGRTDVQSLEANNSFAVFVEHKSSKIIVNCVVAVHIVSFRKVCWRFSLALSLAVSLHFAVVRPPLALLAKSNENNLWLLTNFPRVCCFFPPFENVLFRC